MMSDQGKPWPAFFGKIVEDLPDWYFFDESGVITPEMMEALKPATQAPAYREVWFPPIGLTKRQKRSIPKLR